MSKTQFSPLFKGEMPFQFYNKENERRIHVLFRGDKQHKRLAEKLKACRPKHRCLSSACATCTMHWRRPRVRTAARLFRTLDDVCFVTLVPDKFFVSKSGLENVKIGGFKNRLFKKMGEHLSPNTIAMGIIEASYDDKLKRVSVHMHLVIANNSKEQINRLRRFYTSVLPNLIRGMNVKEVDETPEDIKRTISYTMKGTTDFKPKVKKPKSFKPKKGKSTRSPEDIERALLLFRDRHKLNQFRFLKNLKKKGILLKPTISLDP